MAAPLAVPVTVITYEPGVNVLVPVSETVEDGLPVVSGLVPNTTVVPAGLPLKESVTGLLNPPLNTAVKLVCREVAAGQAEVTGAGALNVNPPALVIVKFELEISKKILPTASTLILAVVVAIAGMVKISVPSLGVLAANTIGKLCPPSVDNEIFTLAQLTGAAVVLVTFHVMV